MSSISRKTFMAEMKNLLSFMDGEDRDRALARYDDLFSTVGEENEDALIATFGSAVRQVLSLEKELREAQKTGITPFLQPMPVPAEFRSDGLFPEKGTSAEFKAGSADPVGQESFVKAAAGALEDENSEVDFRWETISSMDEGFPMDSLASSGEPPMKTRETVFPEVQYGMPDEPAPIPEEDVIPVDEPAEPETGTAGGEPVPAAVTPEERADRETGERSRYPYAVSAEKVEAVFAGVEPIDMSVPDTSAPRTEDVPEADGNEIPDTVIDPMTPETEPPAPGKTVPEPVREPEPERTLPEPVKTGPGAGRIIAAILVTFPFIILWAASFALFVVLGIAVMALGFVGCAAGIYLTGYVTGGKLGFMPDLMLVTGAALVLFGLALLFLWMGLWIAVGGFASVLHWTGSVYRSILKKKVPRKGGAQ